MSLTRQITSECWLLLFLLFCCCCCCVFVVVDFCLFVLFVCLFVLFCFGVFFGGLTVKKKLSISASHLITTGQKRVKKSWSGRIRECLCVRSKHNLQINSNKSEWQCFDTQNACFGTCLYSASFRRLAG